MVESLPTEHAERWRLERHPEVVIYAFGRALAPAEQSNLPVPRRQRSLQGW